MKRLFLGSCAAAVIFGIASCVCTAAAPAHSVLLKTEYLSDYDEEAGKSYGSGHLQMPELAAEDAAEYPALSQVLASLGAEMSAEQKARFEEYTAWARESANGSDWDFEAYLQTDIYIRRVDDSAFSFIMTYSDYSGGAHGYYSSTGYSYRTADGGKISLTEVVADDAAFRDVVCGKLREKYGESLYEDFEEILGSYSVSGNEYEYNWVLDPDGVRVMFNPYELAPYASGAQQVLIRFDEYPQVFTGAFGAQEGAFARQIHGQFDEEADINGDGIAEVFSVTENYDENYTMTGITVSVGDESTTLDGLYFYDPFYMLMHTGDGHWYLYADITTENDYRMIEVFTLDGGKPVFAGEVDAGFGSVWNSAEQTGGRLIPVTPEEFILGYRIQLLSTHTGQRKNRVGEDGMPQTLYTQWYTANELSPVTLKVVRDIPATVADDESLDLPAEEMTGTEGYIHAGETVTIWRSDGSSMIDLKREDGSAARVHIDTSGWPHTINGEDESSYFEQLYYAG